MTHNCPFCNSVSGLHQDDKKNSKLFFHCQSCKLFFLDSTNYLSLTEEEERYQLHENDPQDQGYIKYLKNSTDLLIPYLQSDWDGLDFGCGPGPAMDVALKGKVKSVSSYDPIYKSSNDLLANQFDFITCVEAAEHFYKPNLEFQKIEKLLKNNGLLLIRTEFYTADIDLSTWYYSKDPTHVCFYSLSFFEKLEEISHLRIVETNHKNQILLRKTC